MNGEIDRLKRNPKRGIELFNVCKYLNHKKTTTITKHCRITDKDDIKHNECLTMVEHMGKNQHTNTVLYAMQEKCDVRYNLCLLSLKFI